MRNLFILTTAGAGVWTMWRWVLSFSANMANPMALADSPLAGLLIAPALLAGALTGALLGGLLYPGR